MMNLRKETWKIIVPLDKENVNSISFCLFSNDTPTPGHMIKLLSCRDLLKEIPSAFKKEGIQVLNQIVGESEKINDVHCLLSHLVFPQYIKY